MKPTAIIFRDNKTGEQVETLEVGSFIAIMNDFCQLGDFALACYIEAYNNMGNGITAEPVTEEA